MYLITCICHHVDYFWYIIVYSCIIYVHECMYHRLENFQYYYKYRWSEIVKIVPFIYLGFINKSLYFYPCRMNKAIRGSCTARAVYHHRSPIRMVACRWVRSPIVTARVSRVAVAPYGRGRPVGRVSDREPPAVLSTMATWSRPLDMLV